ncbi:MAG TPA: M20 family metallo-hydrolase [Noviherbaspirillum sp.]
MSDNSNAILGAEAISAMAHVRAERLISTQRALARFGLREDGGVAREALTPVELDARRWLCSLFADGHYSWHVDAAANLFLRRAGREDLDPVVTGSHIDTQPVGGWLDGAYGVIAGIEAMRALDDAGIRTRRPIEVAVWTNEEGSRFNPGAMGSSSFADPTRLPALLQAQDVAGVRFETARDAALAATPQAGQVPLGRRLHAYVEAHIEQGPILEAGGFTLGVVTGIQGVRWFEFTVLGSSAHAGTTPLAARQDALMTAARLVARIGELGEARDDGALRITVGRFEAAPGSINTVADHVLFTVDLRHPQESMLEDIEAALRALAEEAGGNCRCTMRRLMQRAPTRFDADVLKVIDAGVAHSGVPASRLGSGAFHDAMYLADVCPTAMLFVPSRGGISHNPAEDTAEADLAAGARVLAGVLTALANS